MSFKVNAPIFFQRVKKLLDTLKETDLADSLAIISGTDAPQASLMVTLHNWIFGYEFTETLFLLSVSKSEVIIFTSKRKMDILNVLTTDVENEGISVRLIEKFKEEEQNTENTQKCITFLKEQGSRVAALTEEQHVGKFVSAWQKLFENEDLKLVDVANTLAELFAVKDPKEIKNIKSSAAISSHIFSKKLINQLETIIDEEKKITHLEFGQSIEKLFEDPSKFNKKLSADIVQNCYVPIIQSGPYDLSPFAENDENTLNFGTIVCSLGSMYLNYCSNVARTFMVNPTPDQEENYVTLLEAHAKLIKLLRPGATLGQVYQGVLEVVTQNNKALVPHFQDHCGFGMGLDFEEKHYRIEDGNDKVIKENMCFCAVTGFKDIKDPSTSKVYSLILSDTVIITEDGSVSVTDAVSKKKSEVLYFIEEEKPKIPKKQVKLNIDKIAEDKYRETTKKRVAQKSEAATSEEKRKQHQAELEEKSRQEILDRLTNANNNNNSRKETKREVESYKTAADFPAEISSKTKIFIDLKRETVLLPIYGLMTPFHVSTIKTASKLDDEYLKITFITPDTSAAQFGLKNFNQSEEVKKSVHIKELTYRILDDKSLNNTLRLIKELRKRITSREKERQDKSTLVKQDKLVLARGKNPKLTGVFVRPTMSGKRTNGSLECHSNGLRFTSVKNETLDIIFNNIKHAFFQPAENELLVLVHFHFHSDIMVGKKKTKDIQFYSEVMETSQALDTRGGGYDDEFDEEERERAMKARLNKDFQKFVTKVEEASPLDFDMPYRDLGFHGVPHRSLVLLQPTVHCLINLLESPFTVISLSEIEIAYFERVHFNLKNFDLVFIWKDYDRPVSHITSIAAEHLESIKEWLDSCQIKYYEGAQTLNWGRIMPLIRADPLKFHQEEGGWSFLKPESDNEQEEGSDSLPDDDEDFDESEVSSDDDEDFDDSESDFSDDEDESDPDESEEEEEEGEDWDELERKAKEEDRKRREREYEEDRASDRKKKNTSSSSKKKR